ncbi:MAG: glycosyltransferase family 2 protein [Leptolyngbyaceae cyanobacterium]
MALSTSQPKVQIGIVLTTYNPNVDHFLAQIRSIQQQDFQHWHCLIADDGSKPEIQASITEAVAGDRRFTVHIQPHNLGSYHNFEYGLRYFQADEHMTYIAFSDQDDVWYPHKLSCLLSAITQQKALLIHSDLTLIDAAGTVQHPSVWAYEKRQPEKLDAELLLLRNTVTGCSAMVSRQLLAAALPFPLQERSGDWYHDHWLALAAAHQGKIAHVRQPLGQYRQHDHNVVGAEKQAGTIRIEILLWLKKKGRLTLQSYRIHRALSQAFFQRFYSPPISDRRNPFSETHFDFGWSILKLGLRSYQKGYGSQGITLRLWLNKFIFDIRRLNKKLMPTHAEKV